MTAPSTLVILDVGHGSSAILTDGGAVAVIDAGPGSALLEYLGRAKISTIDLVLVSHSDEDHLGGLVALLGSDEFTVKTILINSDSEKDSRIWHDFKEIVDEKCNSGTLALRIGVYSGPIQEWKATSTSIEAVSPSVRMALGGPGSKGAGGKKVDQNTNSIAVRLMHNAAPVAFLGADIDATTVSDIARNAKNCSAPFLVFPHHGGKPGTGDPTAFARDLIGLVQPTYVIFSNGRGKHDAPRQEIVAALMDKGGIRVGCTQVSKRCCPSTLLKPTGHVSSHYSHGAASGHSCTGTIEIDLESRSISSPSLDKHKEFVLSFPDAMCRGFLSN